MRIVGISDLHYANDNTGALDAIDDIINNVSGIDIVVAHGDIVHCPLQPTAKPHSYDYDPDRIRDDLDTIVSKIETIDANEFYYTTGNHDISAHYLRKFGKSWHIVEKDTFILAVLDSSLNYWFGAIQYKQIVELKKLVSATNKAVLAFMHYLPMDISDVGHSGVDHTYLMGRHRIYWVARNGPSILDELDALGVKVIILTGHVWPSDAGTATYGNNVTVGYKKHTWRWDDTNDVSIWDGHSWVIDVDENAKSIDIQVFDHSTKSISSVATISY